MAYKNREIEKDGFERATSYLEHTRRLLGEHVKRETARGLIQKIDALKEQLENVEPTRNTIAGWQRQNRSLEDDIVLAYKNREIEKDGFERATSYLEHTRRLLGEHVELKEPAPRARKSESTKDRAKGE